ncbi:hypothetical protein Sta7437_1791 [Stanieria cyanosphaera PCC 7437]|uniref:Uncharacterized protein n=1 Tax=Stanieria cyanosphaera (strain ATCC 29371 / PCC 7437) TaxID=111780 RepID=K9XTG1_STAC7|nr:hypothetical protein [Stanieria cyanosphaera]AFZ35349.1 hypothetical protein Sta7437_1791 [Stanieria cyanosphaera PCC 7437]
MPIIYLLIVLFCLFILIKYWYIFVSLIAGIIGLYLATKLISYILLQQKITKIQNSDVVSIPSQTLYSIPIDIVKIPGEPKKSVQWIVKSIRPELNDGILNFVKLEHEINKTKLIKQENPKDTNFQTIKKISSLTKEIFNKINPQITELNNKKNELKRLENLVLTSNIYQSKAQLYSRAGVQVQQLIQTTEDLKHEYSQVIREELINAELCRFDPESISHFLEEKIVLQAKYEAIRTQCQDLKNEIEAYTNLTKQSSV